VFDPDSQRLFGRALLAEDHPVNQRVGTIMLEHLGFEVDVVADGARAVEAAMLMPYHVILMDCQIPVLDGLEATAAIRDLQGSTQRTPIIAVTACDAESDHERCLAAGMDGYLTKPLNLKTLAAALAHCAPNGSDPLAVEPLELVAALAGPTRGADPTRPVLDPNVLARLERLGHSVGEDLVAQLAVLFLADANSRVAALHEALTGNDAGAVACAAHSLSGASANLGATQLARVLAAMATDGEAGDLTSGAELLAEAEAELARVHWALATPKVGT
jgi:two-component system, sensor histidine kinase and response regulator